MSLAVAYRPIVIPTFVEDDISFLVQKDCFRKSGMIAWSEFARLGLLHVAITASAVARASTRSRPIAAPGCQWAQPIICWTLNVIQHTSDVDCSDGYDNHSGVRGFVWELNRTE